jgi:hypothetical protein
MKIDSDSSFILLQEEGGSWVVAREASIRSHLSIIVKVFIIWSIFSPGFLFSRATRVGAGVPSLFFPQQSSWGSVMPRH